MQALKTLLGNALHLFYPHVCTGCGSDLLHKNNLLCVRCINDLPGTGFAPHAGNPIEKIFWGRIPVAAAHSQFYFSKESLIQHLIHQLKYKNNTAIGMYLGELLGNTLLQSKRFENIDYLIPLPLYADKERQRGYNQAAVICNGISAVMNTPVLNGNVLRQRFTETQTRKHRIERWENVEGSFIISNAAALSGKSILLIDDVITTGATLEACGSILTRICDVQLYIACLAHAGK